MSIAKTGDDVNPFVRAKPAGAGKPDETPRRYAAAGRRDEASDPLFLVTLGRVSSWRKIAGTADKGRSTCRCHPVQPPTGFSAGFRAGSSGVTGCQSFGRLSTGVTEGFPEVA